MEKKIKTKSMDLILDENLEGIDEGPGDTKVQGTISLWISGSEREDFIKKLDALLSKYRI